ncbi:DUF29 domain-containing protein [Endozoicomonas sp. ONNA1]|uniref:DUF29 domain-containing protein n=1 Tax=Endozoicomonas sp. ONNA1 TaxID=2828740 RepID=UPI0021475456|nr:DUF29 domain-containing protein [Endozoicomonas sp. ONNA1]
MKSLYERDPYSWAHQQAQLLREGKLNELDVLNLIEEVEDLGNSRSDAVESFFIVIITHLLKWQYQPEHRCSSWRGSINNGRRQIARKIKKNPGLKPKLDELYSDVYEDAAQTAVDETELARELFPKENPWTKEQVMDTDFWPED